MNSTTETENYCKLKKSQFANGHDDCYKLKDIDCDRFLNAVARAREPSFVRRLSHLITEAPPDSLSVGGGLPNSSKFPFKDAVFNLKSGESLVLDENKMEDAQQYGPTTGYPPLLKQVKELVLRYHNPPNYSRSKVTITVGAQDGFARTLEMVLSAGDYMIVEDPTFCGTLSVVRPMGVNLLGIKTDDLGMIPEDLVKVLSKWDPEETRDAIQGIPKLLYFNPTAANPSGVTIATERKRQIYRIARLYNLLIVEDDPYFFLQFGDSKSFPTSFLSMDTDGRVMRLDSFAKIIGAGFRVGYLTGPEKLVSKYVEHSEMTILHVSSLSQIIINELLKKWTFDGLESHVDSVREFYKGQREALIQAAQTHLADICEWNVPAGGMFLWLKVLVLEDTEEMVMKRGIQKKLILMPGNSFFIDEKKPCPYLRLSYSFISPEELNEACRRLRELILEEVELCNKKRDENRKA